MVFPKKKRAKALEEKREILDFCKLQTVAIKMKRQYMYKRSLYLVSPPVVHCEKVLGIAGRNKKPQRSGFGIWLSQLFLSGYYCLFFSSVRVTVANS